MPECNDIGLITKYPSKSEAKRKGKKKYIKKRNQIDEALKAKKLFNL